MDNFKNLLRRHSRWCCSPTMKLLHRLASFGLTDLLDPYFDVIRLSEIL
jgi:hypothetical protein